MSNKPKTIDEKIKLLQEIVAELESAELPLEESLKQYKEGQALIKELTEDFKKVREEITNNDN